MYPAVPALLAFVAALAFSVLYSVQEDDYRAHCFNLEKDMLQFFLGGSVICWLILPLGTIFFCYQTRILRDIL